MLKSFHLDGIVLNTGKLEYESVSLAPDRRKREEEDCSGTRSNPFINYIIRVKCARGYDAAAIENERHR